MFALAEEYFVKGSSSQTEPNPLLQNSGTVLHNNDNGAYLGSSLKDKVHDDDRNGEFFFDSAVLTQVVWKWPYMQ